MKSRVSASLDLYEIKEHSVIEKFKLWLRDGDHEFGVFVRIEYSTETEKVMNIQFKETAK
ncbi:DUF3889 domain-containing protein [Sporosarcina sp. FA9]|uniref:DUF3889 domain-containing protein n=1 Tax=Sporosarcina sp. FA9 TaxID=3413030 RepID=UPI003F660565